MRHIIVTACPPVTLLEDLGRPGYASMGVGTSGAADRGAHRLANRLVGNPEGAATLEVMLGAFAFRAECDLVMGVTGAPCPVQVAGRPASANASVAVMTGQEVLIGPATAGLRYYVALNGGIVVDPVLGSRSYDSMARLGPPPVAAGDTLPLGTPLGDKLLGLDEALGRVPNDAPIEVRAIAGPRDEWVQVADLFDRAWEVSSRSDRVGVRLEGTPLRRTAEYEGRELASEGVVRGSVQVPTGGLPVLFMSDHPVTGGYPVVAVICEADVDLVAQARPGQEFRFRRVPAHPA